MIVKKNMKFINQNKFFYEMTNVEIQKLAIKFHISTNFVDSPVHDRLEKERIFKEITSSKNNLILKITLVVASLALIVTTIMLIKMYY